MIDRRRRDQLAEAVRHFSAGLLTNDEYEKRVERAFDGIRPRRQADLALWAVHDQVWFLYDDMRTHRLTGRWALTTEARAEIARWVMFLYTNQEYEWPITGFISPSSCLMRLLTFGLWDLVMGPYRERQLAAMGDWNLWPFIATSHYEDARRKPRLLHGAV